MASGYGHLSDVMKARGKLEEAEILCRKAVAIEEQIGRVEGMTWGYAHLGKLLADRGDLEGAESTYRKWLAVEQGRGPNFGVANACWYIGRIGKARGNLAVAREMWTRARDLFTKLGSREWAAKAQSLIDGLKP
jgi:tetratricopeptide (TPR) repeat protein